LWVFDFQRSVLPAWEIGKEVFHWEGRRSIEEQRDQGYMLSGSRIGPFARGMVMVAQFEPVDSEKTRDTVITKRLRANPASPMIKEDTFHLLSAEAVKKNQEGTAAPR
jgi:hypothetical protein